jgi:DNA-binding response OmpR family regulator/HPt (histidine-containing phosphotransfer) domain-containing protein
MNKYKQSLIKNIRKQLEAWLNEPGTIGHTELYRFLHSITGTAATIGLDRAGDTAQSLMGQLEEKEQREWSKAELQQFLLPLISNFYYEEYTNIDEIIGQRQELQLKKLILLIDDDTSLIMYLKDALEENGWSVIAIADPERAFQALNELNPDCVIINSQIKGDLGQEVLMSLRNSMKQPHIPIIMMSNVLSKEIRSDSYRNGADDVMETSIEIDELMVRIKRQLERKQAIDELIHQTKNVLGNQNRNNKKIINVGVVDDDPIIQTMLTDLISKSKMIEEFTLNLKSFTDGMEFYDSKWYLESEHPYLIILDGMMPRMDGLEVLQMLRDLPNQEKYTIIMLTTRRSGQDIARAIQLGADDYITKPFKLLELESRLGHLIKRVK